MNTMSPWDWLSQKNNNIATSFILAVVRVVIYSYDRKSRTGSYSVCSVTVPDDGDVFSGCWPEMEIVITFYIYV